VDLLAEPNGRRAACHTLAGGWSAPGGQEASCSFTCPGSSPKVQPARSRAWSAGWRPRPKCTGAPS